MDKPSLKLPKIGLALGCGAARGAAHIGVIRGLMDLGIEPNCIAGTSVGSLIAGAYAAGKINLIEDWMLNLKKRTDLLKIFDFSFRDGGLIRGERCYNLLHEMELDIDIDDTRIPVGFVATDMHSGREIWLQSGPLPIAIKASCAMPGIVSPVFLDGKWLFDGAIVNPVPVSLCRALGAEIIIAVNLNHTMTTKRLHNPFKEQKAPSQLNQLMSKWFNRKTTEYKPQYFDVVEATLDIMQSQITKSRMAGEPPDITLCPRLDGYGMFQFDRSFDALQEGYRAVMRNKESLLSLIHDNMHYAQDVKAIAET